MAFSNELKNWEAERSKRIQRKRRRITKKRELWGGGDCYLYNSTPRLNSIDPIQECSFAWRSSWCLSNSHKWSRSHWTFQFFHLRELPSPTYPTDTSTRILPQPLRECLRGYWQLTQTLPFVQSNGDGTYPWSLARDNIEEREGITCRCESSLLVQSHWHR